MDTSQVDTVLIMAAALLPGQTSRHICPVCRATEKSFVVSRLQDGSIAWLCHRASCAAKGRSGDFSYPHSAAVFIPPEPCLLAVPGLKLSRTTRDAWGYPLDENSGGYYRPIVGQTGHIGFQLRWDDGRKPKVRTYLTRIPNCETMHWERSLGTARPATCVLVEDIPSAFCVARAGTDAVALLGTLFTPARAGELKRAGYTTLLFLLDNDAQHKGLQYAVAWAGFFSTVWVPTLQDPKDMAPAALHKLIEDYCGTKTAVCALPPSTL